MRKIKKVCKPVLTLLLASMILAGCNSGAGTPNTTQNMLQSDSASTASQHLG